MDTKKARTALAEANKEIDTIIDAAVKGRKINLLRPLTLAQKNIELVGTHLDKYDERSAPKAVEQPETAPAASGKGKSK